jgi:hypothetical protein
MKFWNGIWISDGSETIFWDITEMGRHCITHKVQIFFGGIRYKTCNSGAFAKPFFPWKISKYQILWACLYTCLNNLACKSHLYWTVRLYHKSSTLPYKRHVNHIFTEPSGSTTSLAHYLINGVVLNKSLLNIKCVFWFSLQRCLKHFSF